MPSGIVAIQAILREERKAERASCLAIITKYRGEAAKIEDQHERERILLLFGLMRSEIENAYLGY